MSTSKHSETKRRFQLNPLKNSAFALILALILLIGGVHFGTTGAWLVASDTADNPVITLDDATLTLTSVAASTTSHQIIPGSTITIGSNGPKVTVPANTLKCYVFIRPIATEPNSIDYFSFAVDSGFTRYSSSSSLYYKVVEKSTSAQTFNTIASITFSTGLTNANIKSIGTGTSSSVYLTLKACAVQFEAHDVKEAYDTACTQI